MSSVWGNNLKISLFGESHGEAIGVVIDTLPAGICLHMEQIEVQMARRAPGQDKTTTARIEKDTPRILSGVLNGVTTGAPLCAVIENTNTQSRDYTDLDIVPRPSHSDYPAYVKYQGHNDIRGGGHFSGRLTAPLVFAGAVCRQILAGKGIVIGGHIAQIGDVTDDLFDLNRINKELLSELSETSFATISGGAKLAMQSTILKARMEQDSVGGVVECAAVGLPVGVGSNFFTTVESMLSSLFFAIPGAKGVEFGLGFGFAREQASRVNDGYALLEGQTVPASNNNGGVLGGMTTGAPVVARVAFKPTPSISLPQDSVNLKTGQPEKLVIHGRHDPCIVGRALPVVEACMAIGLLDLIQADQTVNENE